MISILLCIPQQVFFVSAEEGDETILIKAHFPAATTHRVTELDIHYSDDWFRHDATVYNHDLARASLGLAVTSFRPSRTEIIDIKSEHVQEFLTQAGFSRFREDDYNRPSGRYTIASEIASKTIRDDDGPFTLIAIGIAGQGYGDEWLSNFSVGDGSVHEGFTDASDDIYDRLWGYIAENHIERPFKVWVTGFSRAGAIANIFAAALEKDHLLDEKDVFAYTFATPRTTKNPESGHHDNIFNIVGAVDPVPQIPFQDWGFDRYGTTFFTPAQETTSTWFSTEKKANEVYRDIVGFDTWNNPVINTQIKVLTEYLLEICPDNKTYAKHLQDAVCEMWKNSRSPIDLMRTLMEVSQNSELITPDNAAEANSLLDYALYTSLQYLSYSDRMVYLEDRAPMAANIMHEHTPEVYISWMFSDTAPEELFTDNRSFARLTFEGDTSIDIYQDTDSDPILLETVSADGNITYQSDDVHLFALRTGEKTVLFVPYDADYRISLRQNSDTTVNVIGIDYTSEQTRVTKYWQAQFILDEGSFTSIGLGPSSTYTNSVTDKDDIQQIRSETTQTLSSIQQFETLNVLDLEWRDFVVLVTEIFIFTFTILIFILSFVTGKLRWRRTVKSGLCDKNIKYSALPVFCLCFVFDRFLMMQIFGALFPDGITYQVSARLLIGTLLLITAWNGYRRFPTQLNRLNLAALLLFTAADAAGVYSIDVRMIFRIIAILVMLYNFVSLSRPVLSQYVIFVILTGINIFFMILTGRRFVFDHIFWLLTLNMFLSTALFIASLPMPKRYRTGSLLLLISGLSLYAGNETSFSFFTHLLFAGVYYAAMAFFAAASIKIVPKNQAMVPERQQTPAPAETGL